MIMSTIPHSSPRRRSLEGVEDGTPEDQSGTTTIGNRSNSNINGRRKDDSIDGGRKRKQAWYIRWIKSWGSGMRKDITHRLPYYWKKEGVPQRSHRSVCTVRVSDDIFTELTSRLLVIGVLAVPSRNGVAGAK